MQKYYIFDVRFPLQKVYMTEYELLGREMRGGDKKIEGGYILCQSTSFESSREFIRRYVMNKSEN